MPPRSTLAAAAAVTTSLALSAPPARASSEITATAIATTTEILVGLPAALVTIPGNIVMLTRSRPPGLGWPVTGLVAGTINLGLGVGVVALSVTETSKVWGPGVAFGVAAAALGVTDIALSAAVLAKRGRLHHAAFLPVPITFPDARGKAVTGFGFQGAF